MNTCITEKDIMNSLFSLKNWPTTVGNYFMVHLVLSAR